MQDTQEQKKCALLLPCTQGDEAQTKTHLPHLASCLGMHPATGITPKSCRNLTGSQGIQAGGRLSIQPPSPSLRPPPSYPSQEGPRALLLHPCSCTPGVFLSSLQGARFPRRETQSSRGLTSRDETGPVKEGVLFLLEGGALKEPPFVPSKAGKDVA